MVKQLKMLEAQNGKIKIPGALSGGDRYICAERLMAAAATGIGKEEKRTLSKKLAEISEEYGGAFRGRVSGADRWFVTRQLLADCLAREIATYRNGTYARFKSSIAMRIRVILDMLAMSERLCKRGFHRTESMLPIDIDRMSGKTPSGNDIGAVMEEASALLRAVLAETRMPASLGDAKPVDEILEMMGGNGEKAGTPEAGAADSGYGSDSAPSGTPAATPAEIIGILTNTGELPEDTAAKLRHRMCALSTVMIPEKRGSALTDIILSVREAMIHPYRPIAYADWLAVFGVNPDAGWAEAGDSDRFDGDALAVVNACRGVWDSNRNGPVKSMFAHELLLNCLTKI